MTMKITITVEDPSISFLSNFAIWMEEEKDAITKVEPKEAEVPYEVNPVEVERPFVATSEPEPEPEGDVDEERIVQSGEAPEEAATEPNAAVDQETSPEAPESDGADPVTDPAPDENGTGLVEIIAAMNAKYKPTARLGIEGGQVGKGDRVCTEEGEVGTVMSTWRGRALIQFTDERLEVLEAGQIALADASSGKTESQYGTETDLRDKASELVKKKGAGVLTAILKKFGAARVSQLTPDQYEKCARDIAEAMEMA